MWNLGLAKTELLNRMYGENGGRDINRSGITCYSEEMATKEIMKPHPHHGVTTILSDK